MEAYIGLAAQMLWSVIMLGVFFYFVRELVRGRRREKRNAAMRSAWLRAKLDEVRAGSRQRGL
ncbi:hypothetical protein [Arthrobacter sp. KK5.5]|uniref:hypothetical protein n=1 Tax=Arthrobacter sp. KK5.5 TaxID=3373084 RepID=UPI003EE46443